MKQNIMKNNIVNPNMDFKHKAEIYKNMYLKLFNSVTDALITLYEKDDVFKMAHILKQAQCECEEIYIAG